MQKFALLVLGSAALGGCSMASPFPPRGFMDAPAIEFRNAAGEGRWCPVSNAPGVLSEANYRACRDEVTGRGFQEVGPWCADAAPTAGETAAAALLGGIRGLVTAQARAEHHASCQNRNRPA